MVAPTPSSPTDVSASTIEPEVSKLGTTSLLNAVESDKKEVETEVTKTDKSNDNDVGLKCDSTNEDTKDSNKQESSKTAVVNEGEESKKSYSDSSLLPTYATTKDSEAYYTAKNSLNEGDFEEALTTIESEIQVTLSLLPEESSELHESLAPFYYLYGTTLLYSVEESNDPSSTMVGAEEEGSDLQIAWENLDSARTILETLDQKVDLAQVYQRLGDLQRANGNYKAAIEDYERCLELRMVLTGLYNRKVADCHHSLGVAYQLLAAEKEEESSVEENKVKSILHYFESIRTFAGLVAIACGAKAETIVSPSVTAGARKKADDSFLTGDVSTLKDDLKSIRSKLDAVDVLEEENNLVDEYKEIMDEIQETIENSDDSIKVLKDVNKNKEEYAKSLKDDETPHDAQATSTAAAGTTTIGFGSAAASSTSNTTIGFASAASSSTPQTVNTLIVKKKKRPVNNDTHSSNCKKPKPSAE